MIDPHVHLRDGIQSEKETVKHGLKIAYHIGGDAVKEMPNTNPALTSRKKIEERIEVADTAIRELKSEYGDFNVCHFISAGITSDFEQIKEVVQAWKDLERVAALKTYWGESTGELQIIKEDAQRFVWRSLVKLDFRGVNEGHCEKESLMKPELWDYKNPFTHTLARPPEAEVESVKDQIRFAHEAKYRGTLHICHISVPQALEEIEKARNYVDFKITCGLTPHHAMLYDELMNKTGLLLKMNPPLRPRWMQEYMLDALLHGRIDWVETDHAPHTLDDKLNPGKKNPFASGIEVLRFYPYFIDILRKKGASEELIDDITHNNIAKAYGLDIKNTKRKPNYNLENEYEFDVFKSLKK